LKFVGFPAGPNLSLAKGQLPLRVSGDWKVKGGAQVPRGLTSSALFIEASYAASGAPALREAYLAAAVAGVPGFTFIAVTLLLTGVYCVIGNVIGVYIRKLF
jgi:hypothetical protein